MQRLIYFIIPAFLYMSCSAQQPQTPAETGIMFYNLENLFDTIDDPNIDDRIF